MSEVRFTAGDADAGLAERLDKEIGEFNAAATHSFQAPGFCARFGYTECGRTPGYPHGHDDIRCRS